MNNKWKGNDTDMMGRRGGKVRYFMILDSFLQLYHCIVIIPQQNQRQEIALEQLHSFLATWGNPSELREVDQR